MIVLIMIWVIIYFKQKNNNHLLEKKDEVKIVQPLNLKKMIKIMTVDDNSSNTFVIKNFLKKFKKCYRLNNLKMEINVLECIELYKKSN